MSGYDGKNALKRSQEKHMPLSMPISQPILFTYLPIWFNQSVAKAESLI